MKTELCTEKICLVHSVCGASRLNLSGAQSFMGKLGLDWVCTGPHHPWIHLDWPGKRYTRLGRDLLLITARKGSKISIGVCKEFSEVTNYTSTWIYVRSCTNIFSSVSTSGPRALPGKNIQKTGSCAGGFLSI